MFCCLNVFFVDMKSSLKIDLFHSISDFNTQLSTKFTLIHINKVHFKFNRLLTHSL